MLEFNTVQIPIYVLIIVLLFLVYLLKIGKLIEATKYDHVKQVLLILITISYNIDNQINFTTILFD